jgi:hypothetical protein
MHGFVNFGAKIQCDPLVLNVIEQMTVRMHFGEVPVFIFKVCVVASIYISLTRLLQHQINSSAYNSR